MLTKATAKFIKSLQLKKYRKQEQSFLVEGAKSVLEVLKSDFEIKQLIATEEFIDSENLGISSYELITASPSQITDISSYKSNNDALAVVSMKPNDPLQVNNEYALILDTINDPGNLGTIIRVADWYGITKIIASEATVDHYNPKVVAATKGSFCRVSLYYTDLEKYLKQINIPVIGACMEGENIHGFEFPKEGLVVLGNEANGISVEISKLLDRKITIPRYGGAESLNVAMATAIVCDNLKRKK